MLSVYYSLLSLIPVLIYILIIYLTTPSTLNLKYIFKYFIGGIMGIGFLLSIFRVFPNIQDEICLNFILFGSSIDPILIFSFIQVGLIEELSKFFGFRIIEKKTTPIDTMIYCGITALGFSFVENITYLLNNNIEIIFIRSTMSMILHLTCGLLMGYFIAVGRIKQTNIDSPLGKVMLVYPKFKRRLYYFIGVLSATMIHGFYDFVNFIPDKSMQPFVNMILIITFGFIVNLLLSKDLINKIK